MRTFLLSAICPFCKYGNVRLTAPLPCIKGILQKLFFNLQAPKINVNKTYDTLDTIKSSWVWFMIGIHTVRAVPFTIFMRAYLIEFFRVLFSRVLFSYMAVQWAKVHRYCTITLNIRTPQYVLHWIDNDTLFSKRKRSKEIPMLLRVDEVNTFSSKRLKCSLIIMWRTSILKH